MTQTIKTFITLLGVIFSFTLQAQTEPEPAKKPELPGSFLRILYTPLNLSVAEGADLNLNIEWEKPITPHLSFDLSFYKDFNQTRGASPDVFNGTRDIFTNDLNSGVAQNILTSLGVGLNYYFKPDAYDGLYASVRLNNFITHSHRSYPVGGGELFTQKNRIDSAPIIGFYLGYRKVFDNNFFIDSRIGYTPYQGYTAVNGFPPNVLDFRIGIGYQFKLKGKKKKKR